MIRKIGLYTNKRHLLYFRLSILAVIMLIIMIGVICSHYQNTSPKRPKDRYTGEVTVFKCRSDQDADGIDDQTDILENVLHYVSTRPKYKSRYYPSGYPDDHYGVCTDVVAFALREAGYDLMELVNEDVHKNPDAYDIDEPDKKIDFRRVKNLKVYFSHTAIGLTTDPGRIGEWQGGDIVLFSNHVGIISDRRNKDGAPYVIHHNDPWQRAYEQDILEDREDIVGHYRISEGTVSKYG